MPPMAWTALGFVAVTGVLFAIGLFRVENASREAVVCEAVCREVLANTTEGRQALVSSAWWPPLPVLIRLPVAALVNIEACPVASLLVSALGGAAVLFLLYRVFTRWRLGWLRFLLLAALVGHPLFWRECTNGASTTAIIYLTLLTGYGLVEWLARREVKYLVYLALSTSLLVWMNFEMGVWFWMVVVLVIADLLAYRQHRPHQREAILLLVLLPPLYTMGLWLLLNWLIMGDALYFVRSLITPGFEQQFMPAQAPHLAAPALAAAGVSLLTLVLAGLRRNRAATFLACLAVSPLVLALFLAGRNLLWDQVPVLFSLLPLCILAVAYILTLHASVHLPIRVGLALMPLAVTGAALIEAWGPPPVARSAEPAAGVYGESNWYLPQIQQHIRAQTKYAKVFVCGYDSFALLGNQTDPLFVHAMDFNFNKALHDYPGQRLYLLIHRPAGRSAMESVHWKYEQIFTWGSSDLTLYDGDWGDWRLFEIIHVFR